MAASGFEGVGLPHTKKGCQEGREGIGRLWLGAPCGGSRSNGSLRGGVGGEVHADESSGGTRSCIVTRILGHRQGVPGQKKGDGVSGKKGKGKSKGSGSTP